jgi:hypothetical protein
MIHALFLLAFKSVEVDNAQDIQRVNRQSKSIHERKNIDRLCFYL